MSPSEVTSCEEALRLLSAYLDGELGEGAGDDVERHLATCKSCYSRSEFERRLKEKLAGSGRADVDDALQNRVEGLIRKFNVAPSK